MPMKEVDRVQVIHDIVFGLAYEKDHDGDYQVVEDENRITYPPHDVTLLEKEVV